MTTELRTKKWGKTSVCTSLTDGPSYADCREKVEILGTPTAYHGREWQVLGLLLDRFNVRTRGSCLWERESEGSGVIALLLLTRRLDYTHGCSEPRSYACDLMNSIIASEPEFAQRTAAAEVVHEDPGR